jgi:hypothetical protein
MMQDLTLTVNVPDLADFGAKYKQYGQFARGEGGFLFELLMRPSSFIRMIVATLDLELPAVAGVAKICYEAVSQNPAVDWNYHTKQYIGAVACTMMEANGFNKTGRKKAIPHPGFTKGEVYEIDSVVDINSRRTWLSE